MRNGPDRPTPAEQKALAALASLPRPRPSAAAREKARAAFLGQDRPGAEVSAPPEPTRRSRRWLAIPLAAALVAVMLVAGWYGLQPRSQWFVTDVVSPAGIVAEAPALATGAEVEAGLVITGAESELELQLGQELRFRMLPSSQIQLPAPPARWFGQPRTLRLEQGEIYGTTGGQELSFLLQFETLEVTAQLAGTTFAVFRTDEGSCVCLWTGGIVVTPRDSGQAVALEPETKFYVYTDGRPNEVQPIDDMERMKLSMMHEGGIIPRQISPEGNPPRP
jgi:ferric-dicitrate binding protein FerR (iron transport regulator)